MKRMLGLLLVMGMVGCGEPTLEESLAAWEKLGGRIEREQGEVVAVDFPDGNLTDAGLMHLKRMTNLETLDLKTCTQITDAGLVHIKDLTNLQWIDLTNTKVTDTGLLHLKGMTNLQELSLGNTKVTDAGVAALQKALPNCKITK